MRKVFLILLIVLILVPIAQSKEYYADVNIEVEDTGLISIQGITNHPNLRAQDTSEYTSKTGNYWILNITINDVFSDYVYSLKLPEGSVINYIKSTDKIGIKNINNRILIDGVGRNESLLILVQYSISPQSNQFQFILIIPVLIFVLGLFYWFKIRKKRKPKKYNLDLLTERQKMILKTLEKHKKPVSQKTIEREVDMPKSSLSRNIDSLIKKGIIKKERRGMTNMIYFSKENE